MDSGTSPANHEPVSVTRDFGQHPSRPVEPSARYTRLAPKYLKQLEAETFTKFQKDVIKLEEELFNFANAARRLRESSVMISCARNLENDLSNLLHILRKNASYLCPGTIHNVDEKRLTFTQTTRNPDPLRAPSPQAPSFQAPSFDEERDIAPLVEEMRQLEMDVTALLKSLGVLTQFEDKEIQKVFKAFAADLLYWVSCLELEVYRGRFDEMAVRRFVNDLTSGICEHLRAIVESLAYFTETAIPMVAIAQHHEPGNIQTLTTVATFFSAVTATTLQITWGPPHDTKGNVVNGFWFSSLVFSVASTVNLLLGALLMRALYRTPVRVPRPIYLWLYRSPLVFLVIAVVCFSIGLVVFAYSSSQHRSVSTIATAFSAFTYMGVAVVLAWFALARRAFLLERDASQKVQRSYTTSSDESKSRQSTLQPNIRLEIPTPRHEFSGRHLDEEAGDLNAAHKEEPLHMRSARINDRRLAGVANKVRWALVATRLMGGPAQAQQLASEGHEPFRSYLRVTKNEIDPGSGIDDDIEQGGIKHLSFSPTGRLLAVCGGRTFSSIWTIENTFGRESAQLLKRLDHARGPADQVVWSPDGKHLITKLRSEIIGWSENGGYEWRIMRENRIKSVFWAQEGEHILSLERNTVVRMSIDGKKLAEYSFGTMRIRSIAIPPQPGSPVLLAAGVLSPTHDGPKPSDPKFEHRCLIVYDMNQNKVKVQIPFFNDIYEVTVARNGRSVLVTFKDQMPSQLWQIEAADPLRDQHHDRISLLLSEVYTSTETARHFTRLSCFGGSEDNFVLCTDTSGRIFIFHRDSGRVHSRILWNADSNERICLAWNRAAQGVLMFVTGSADEGVRVWIAPPKRTQLREEGQGVQAPASPRAVARPGMASPLSYARARLPFRESKAPAGDTSTDSAGGEVKRAIDAEGSRKAPGAESVTPVGENFRPWSTDDHQ